MVDQVGPQPEGERVHVGLRGSAPVGDALDRGILTHQAAMGIEEDPLLRPAVGDPDEVGAEDSRTSAAVVAKGPLLRSSPWLPASCTRLADAVDVVLVATSSFAPRRRGADVVLPGISS